MAVFIGEMRSEASERRARKTVISSVRPYSKIQAMTRNNKGKDETIYRLVAVSSPETFPAFESP
jgi:hypothetical protein